jgi:hypothetical protein
MAVSWHEEAGQFRTDRERVWAHLPFAPPKGLFDAGTDGRVLLGVPKDEPVTPQLRVILNWQHELARKLVR